MDLSELPGNADTFDMIADFCYGIDIKLSVSNVAALRCAAEYLQMTEAMQPGNLIACTDNYLSQEAPTRPAPLHVTDLGSDVGWHPNS